MLSSYIAMAHQPGFIYREFQNPLSSRAEANHLCLARLAPSYYAFNLMSNRFRLNPHVVQSAPGHTLALVGKRQEDMLSPDKTVAELARFLLRQVKHSLRSLCKRSEHLLLLLPRLQTLSDQGCTVHVSFPGSELLAHELLDMRGHDVY